MDVRENNLKVLHNKGYGVEERNTRNGYIIDLYSPKYLYVSHFKDHNQLAEWIERNIKDE